MKKLNLFLVFILCLAIFSSCKKEEKELTPKENLVGKTWVVTDSKTEISIPFVQLPDSLINAFDPTQGIKGQTILFNEDGTFEVGDGTTRQQGNWILSEDNKTLTFTGLVQGDLTQVVDAATLAKLQTFEVTTLTGVKLVIQNSNAVPLPQDLTGLPIPISATVKLNITFDKQ